MRKTIYIDHYFIEDNFYQSLCDDLEEDDIEIESSILEYHDAGALAFAEKNIAAYVSSSDPDFKMVYLHEGDPEPAIDDSVQLWDDILYYKMYHVFVWLMHIWYKKGNEILAAAGFEI